MAFVGILGLIISFIAAVMGIVFVLVGVILSSVGKRKSRRVMKIVGRVLWIIGLAMEVPVIILISLYFFKLNNRSIALPDGGTAWVTVSDADKMWELVEADNADIGELTKLLDKNPNLIYYRDANRQNLIDFGLANGNYAVVQLALECGLIFDDPERYEHMSYVENSMEEYLEKAIEREMTEDDVEIVKLMFSSGVSMECSARDDYVYSNLFGKAVWAILYNDKYVTDTELELLHIFIDNGYDSDSGLLLYEEKPSNLSFGEISGVVRDGNYSTVLTLIGKKR